MPARWMDYVPLDDLQRAPRNPKSHASDLIAESLSRHGYVEPITLDERTGRLVAGHGRLDDLEARRTKGEAAPDGVEVRDGVWLVPVARGWSSKDDAQAAAYLVTSNQTTIAGGWDMPELVDVLSGLAEVNVDELIGTGFGTADIDDLIASLQPKVDPVVLNDPDAVPEPPVEPVTKRGDVWLLGPHRLGCLDCTDDADVMTLMKGERALLMCTDPPYMIGYDAQNHPPSNANRGAANRNKEWSAYQETTEDDGLYKRFIAVACDVALDGSALVYQWHAGTRADSVIEAWGGSTS